MKKEYLLSYSPSDGCFIKKNALNRIIRAVLFLILFVILSENEGFSQSVGIGTTSPDPKAQLDITSSTKGILIPRMTTSLRTAIVNPSKGLMVYDSSAQTFFYHDGTSWQGMGAASKIWGLNGNSGTNPAVNFIGTLDDQPLKFRLNNLPAGSFSKENIFIGLDAGNTNIASGNVGIGRGVLKNSGEGNGNVGIGDSVLFIGGSIANTAIGYRALRSSEYGSQNTAVGYEALFSTANSYFNTAVGYMALRSNLNSNNTAVGYEALKYNIYGGDNTAFGSYALHGNDNGSANTAIGMFSLESNASGNNNTAVGYQTLQSNHSYSNTAIGYQSLQYNNSGNDNVAVGDSALLSCISGSYNTAVGARALVFNNSGSNNIALGYWALRTNAGGNDNIAIGNGSLQYSLNTSFNITMGNYSLQNVSGSYNSSFGAYAGGYSVNNCTCIGYGAGPGYPNQTSNAIHLGNNSVTWIGGIVGWSTYSDERIKQNIKEDVPGLAFIDQLRPVTYNINSHKQNEMMYGNSEDTQQWPGKYDIEKIRMTGFIAQEVELAAKQCEYDFHGVIKPENPDGLYSLTYSEFVTPLVKAVQELHNENSELKKRIELLEQMILEIKAKN